MNMLQQQQIQTSVYLCTFECFIRQANIAMKFPCTYFVEWRTINSKSTVKTDRHTPHENQVNFDTRISLQLQMLFDHTKLQFLKRETIVELFLVSKSRPDQNKLVGRVNIDLGKVINVGMYEQPTEFKLNFCSIEGSLVMQFHPLEQRLTSLTIQDLDKTSFIDFISQTTLKTQNRNQSAIVSRQQIHSVQKIARSQIRAISPGSPKSIIKTNITPRGNQAKFDQQVKKDPSIKDTKAQFSKFLNDQFEANNKATLNGSKVNVYADFLVESHNIAPQIKNSKNSQQKRPSESGLVSRTPQEQILNIPNNNSILKTSSSPMLEQSLKQNINIEKKDSNSHLLLSHKEETGLAQKNNNQTSYKQEYVNQIQAENQNLKHQVTRLLDQYEVLFQEKEKSDRKLNEIVTILQATHAKIKEIELQFSKKDNIIDKNNIDIAEKQNTINYMQEQINRLSSATQKQHIFQVQSLNTRINLLQTQNIDLKESIQRISAQFQQKIVNNQQIIRRLEKDKQENQRSFKTKLQDLQAENVQLVKDLQLARKEVEDKAHFNLRQSVDLQRQTKERSQLQMRLQRLTSQVTEISLKQDQAEKDLNEIQGKYLQLESLYDKQVSENELLNIRLQDMATLKKNPIEVAEEAVVLNRSEVIESLDQVQNNEVMEKLRIENEQLLNEVQFFKSHKELAQQEHKKVLESLLQQNDNMRQQLNNIQKKKSLMTQLQAKINHFQTENAQLLSDNHALKQQITQMSNALYENQQPFKIIQLQNENYRQQAKVFQAEVSFYEKELLIMKDEIMRIRQSREGKQDKIEYEEMISKLNSNLQEQINQNNELSQTIVRYMQKQAKMKQTLAVLQMQSKEIFSLVQQKEKNEETYQKAIQQLQLQILNLKNQQSASPSPQPSPNHNRSSDYSPQRQKMLQDNAELIALIKQLQETNSKLNEELMQISLEYNQSKSKLEEQILRLAENLIAIQNSNKRDDINISNPKLKEYERIIKNKDIELDITKSKAKQRENEHRQLEIEYGKLRATLQEIQEVKFNLQSTINEKDIRIIQLQEEITLIKAITTPNASPSKNETKNDQSNHNLSNLSVITELKEKLLQKSLNSDWDSLLQSILQRSMGGEDTGRLLNLQQKSRLLSKQLQKMKAQLLKSQWRNQQQKVAMMGLFKKCESIVAQLIAAAESLNQNQSSFL